MCAALVECHSTESTGSMAAERPSEEPLLALCDALVECHSTESTGSMADELSRFRAELSKVRSDLALKDARIREMESALDKAQKSIEILQADTHARSHAHVRTSMRTHAQTRAYGSHLAWRIEEHDRPAKHAELQSRRICGSASVNAPNETSRCGMSPADAPSHTSNLPTRPRMTSLATVTTACSPTDSMIRRVLSKFFRKIGTPSTVLLSPNESD